MADVKRTNCIAYNIMVYYFALIILPLAYGQFLNFPTSFPIHSYSLDTCPCKKPPKSNECVSYDPKYSAATLEEGIFNFVDTTTADASNAKTILGKAPAYKTSKYNPLKCDTEECLGCYEMILDRMLDNFGLSTNNTIDVESTNHSVQALVQQALNLGIGKGKKYASYCKALYNATPRRTSYLTPPGMGNTTLLDQIKKWAEIRKHETRPKRETAPPSASTGTSSPIKCDYKRGDPIDSSSNYVGLCSVCWSIRTLPDKYFPRYINERSCDPSDNKCLSSYGACREVYRSIDVLYNYGTEDAPQWAQYSINSPVSCECRVQSDSAMYNFVRS